MKIETNDWVTLAEACKLTGLALSTCRRAARRLGALQVFFGAMVVRKSDLPRIVAEKKQTGNPDWIKSYDAAAAAGLRAVASRLKRIEAVGMTDAELTRGEKIKAAMAERR